MISHDRTNDRRTLCADGHELDALAGDEVERLVDVGDLVEPHLAPVRLGQGLAGDHLQEEHELQPIAEILLDVLDLGAGLPQVGVHPRGERLQRGKNNRQLRNVIGIMIA